MTALDLQVPAAPCTPWCTSGSHEDEHPYDRACWSDFREVPLSAHDPVDATPAGGAQRRVWELDRLALILRREWRAQDAQVVLSYETKNVELVLTVAEAALLRDQLAAMIEVATK